MDAESSPEMLLRENLNELDLIRLQVLLDAKRREGREGRGG